MDSLSMVTGCYQFKINHLKTKDMRIGECIISPKFVVGQHDWAIEYFPRGNDKDNNGKYVSVFLALKREYIPARAIFKFALLDKHGNVSPTTLCESKPQTFTSHAPCMGFQEFFQRDKLEEMYVKNCYFVLFVKITLKDESCLGEHWNSTSSIGFLDERERLQKFREENKRTDVSFDVNGKIFVAHRLILAANSPVFEAELFGSMAKSNIDCITISEMMPSVFEEMLDFMYSGSLSVNEELVDCEGPMSSTTFLQNLLAAADRYAVKKLKATCEYELFERISSDTVLSTLEVAEKHNCSELKKHCFRFIVDKDNLISLLLTEEYIKLMQNYPSLWTELKNLAEN